jgi:DNA-binding NarL/FixJ family response regulator
MVNDVEAVLMGLETASRRKVRVFVADDSYPVRNRLVAMLNASTNLEVVGQAAEAESTLAGVRASHPDVLVLDIRMPGRTGLELLRDLHHEAAAPKVIMVTNYPLEQYRRRCLEAGASYFFDKSTEFDKIPAAAELLGRSSSSAARGNGQNQEKPQ